MFLTVFTSLSVLLFFLYRSPSSSLCTVFDSISPNIDEFSRSTHLLMYLSLETLTPIIRTGLPILVRSGDLCYNFSISNDLTQMVNFPTRIPDCHSHSPALLDRFLSSDASICSTMAFPPF